MTEEHNDNVSTEVVSETSVNEVEEVEVYEEISLFDFVQKVKDTGNITFVD